MTKENLTKVTNDVNGNPRYVVHFTEIDNDYDTAIKKANKIGGRKYHTKSYGGGIVFGSIYNVEKLVEKINLLNK